MYVLGLVATVLRTTAIFVVDLPREASIDGLTIIVDPIITSCSIFLFTIGILEICRPPEIGRNWQILAVKLPLFKKNF